MSDRTYTAEDFRRWGAQGGAKHKAKKISHTRAVELGRLSAAARAKKRARA